MWKYSDPEGPQALVRQIPVLASHPEELLRGRNEPYNRLKYIDMNLIESYEAHCPHCGEPINLSLDLSVPEQSYIEDCSVCCQPMTVSYASVDGELSHVNVEAA
jgi:hypothetical protein